MVDPLTVRLRLKAPFSPLLAQLTDRAGMPLSPTAVHKLGEKFGTAPVCVGPWQFAERVAAIAGQDVEQIVRVAQAVGVPLQLVVELGATHLVGLGDKTGGGQTLAAHEADIGVADAALGQFVDPAMIVEQVGQIGLARHQPLAEVALHEGARIVEEKRAA